MVFFTKKISLLIALISIFALTSFFVTPSIAGDSSLGPKEASDSGIGERFAGEELIYDLGFWIFARIAKGTFTLTKNDDGTYKAVLDAASKSRLFGSTKSTYTAYLKESEDKKRFITISFEKLSKKKNTTKKIVKELDYKKRILKISKWKNGEFRSTEELEIPDGTIYDDPLAAFYNLRYGVYGSMEKGARHKITTFPEKEKEVLIRARVAGSKALKKGRIRRKNNAAFLLDVKLDKELFDSSSGDIQIFFDEEMIPVNVVAKDVLLFGDVYAKLKTNLKKPTEVELRTEDKEIKEEQ